VGEFNAAAVIADVRQIEKILEPYLHNSFLDWGSDTQNALLETALDMLPDSKFTIQEKSDAFIAYCDFSIIPIILIGFAKARLEKDKKFKVLRDATNKGIKMIKEMEAKNEG